MINDALAQGSEGVWTDGGVCVKTVPLTRGLSELHWKQAVVVELFIKLQRWHRQIRLSSSPSEPGDAGRTLRRSVVGETAGKKHQGQSCTRGESRERGRARGAHLAFFLAFALPAPRSPAVASAAASFDPPQPMMPVGGESTSVGKITTFGSGSATWY